MVNFVRNFLIFFLWGLGLPVMAAEVNLDPLFSKYHVKGSIVIYDVHKDQWIYSNEADANLATIPASTFKIVNALIALEEQAVTYEEVMAWDGKDKMFKGNRIQSWNADTHLAAAFKNSTIWFFVELSKRIPRATYASYLKTLDYGNLDLGERGDDFWNYGNMAVSPKNQVVFLHKLYQGQLPFQNQHMERVKSLMHIETNEAYQLSGKSGWGSKDGQEIGWLVGVLQSNQQAYVYATRVVVDSEQVPKNFGKLRSLLTIEAFQQLNLIPQ